MTSKTYANYCATCITDGWPVEEYCAGETFRPRCAGGKSDVIVVLSARYGRMSFGRCLKKQAGLALVMDDPKFLGCSADVKDIIDRHCSGRSECDVRINDQNFEAVKPCYEDLKMHLEASYTCVRGRPTMKKLVLIKHRISIEAGLHAAFLTNIKHVCGK